MTDRDKMYVCCHSPSLALLLFETVSGAHHQEGLLVGSVKTHVVTSTTDENEAIEEEKTVIYIEHCVPVPGKELFGPYGETSASVLKQSCEPHKNKIVGWYSFRRDVKSSRCSLRECLIHKSLLRALEIPLADTFVIALLSASAQPGMSTHAFNHVFFRMNHRFIFEPLRFKIYSLTDKLTNISGYLTNLAFPTAETFQHITDSVVKDRNSLAVVRDIHRVGNERLHDLSQELLKLERRHMGLQQDVDKMLRELFPPEHTPALPTYAPRVQKEELGLRLLKFDPEQDYGGARTDNPMRVSEGEMDSDGDSEPPEQLAAGYRREFNTLPSAPGHRRELSTSQLEPGQRRELSTSQSEASQRRELSTSQLEPGQRELSTSQSEASQRRDVNTFPSAACQRKHVSTFPLEASDGKASEFDWPMASFGESSQAPSLPCPRSSEYFAKHSPPQQCCSSELDLPEHVKSITNSFCNSEEVLVRTKTPANKRPSYSSASVGTPTQRPSYSSASVGTPTQRPSYSSASVGTPTQRPSYSSASVGTPTQRPSYSSASVGTSTQQPSYSSASVGTPTQRPSYSSASVGTPTQRPSYSSASVGTPTQRPSYSSASVGTPTQRPPCAFAVNEASAGTPTQLLFHAPAVNEASAGTPAQRLFHASAMNEIPVGTSNTSFCRKSSASTTGSNIGSFGDCSPVASPSASSDLKPGQRSASSPPIDNPSVETSGVVTNTNMLPTISPTEYSRTSSGLSSSRDESVNTSMEH